MDDYSVAAAMYGLALLNSDYSGDCVTVRRASDNATQDIGFDGQDLDIAALESFCAGTDGFVSVWFDQSGNGANATQTTASLQPKIVSNGSVILENGKPIIQNVVDSNFDVNAALDNTKPITEFAVIKNENTRAILNTYGSFDYVLAAEDGGFSGVFNTHPDNSHLNSSLKTYQNRNDAWDSTINQSLVTFYWSSPAFSQLTNIGWTGTGWSTPSLQTFIIYNSDQSSNRTGIETALNDYYNIF